MHQLMNMPAMTMVLKVTRITLGMIMLHTTKARPSN
jgi:hypothetical protein